MSYRIANAPCSWGVDFADRPENPDWRRVLDEAAAAGFEAIDLGPVGYFPTDAVLLKTELGSRGLSIATGVLFDPLTDPVAFPGILDKTRRTCELLRALEAPRLVIIDCVSKERGRTAGRSEAAPRLDKTAWKAMITCIRDIALLAREEYGVESTLHPHAGCYIEFEDEVEHAMDDLADDLVGLCVDTGHSAYAGIDPAALIRRHGSRVRHMHFKDIDPKVRDACLAGHVDFFAAVARQIFCPLGEGVIDFASVREALGDIGYEGMIVVEQDIDPAGEASPADNAKASYRFLVSAGMAPSRMAV